MISSENITSHEFIGLETEIVNRHLKHCVAETFKSESREGADKKIDEIISLLKTEGENRYAPPRNSRSFTLPNGKVIREDLGLRYRPFGISNALKVGYRINSIPEDSENETSKADVTYSEEYIIDLRGQWGVRVRFMSESEKSLSNYAGAVLSWLTTLKSA